MNAHATPQTAAETNWTLARALAIVDATKNRGYVELPMGREVDRYLRVKKKRLTAASQETWESVLRDFALHFYHATDLAFFELPGGAEPLQEFMSKRWGDAAPRTYNRALVVVGDFFRHQVKTGRMVQTPRPSSKRRRSAIRNGRRSPKTTRTPSSPQPQACATG